MKFRLGIPRKKKIIEFNRILPDVISELNINDQYIIGNIRSSWQDIAGNILAVHSRPDRIFNGVLFVHSDHSTYANDILLIKDSIISRINELYPYSSVKNMKTEIKNIKWNS